MGSQHLRVGCLNVRGLKANTYYTHQLLDQHHIFGISEHWLQSYELQSLQTFHPDFNFLSSAPPAGLDIFKVTGEQQSHGENRLIISSASLTIPPLIEW